MAIGVLDIMHGMYNGIAEILYGTEDIINSVLKGVSSAMNTLIDGYNGTLGMVFGKLGKVDWTVSLAKDIEKAEGSAKLMEEWKGNIQSWIGEAPDNYTSLDQYKYQYKDLGEWYDKGYDKGTELEKSLGDLFDTSKLLEGINPDEYKSDVPGMNEYLESLPNYDAPDVGGSTDLPDDVKNAIDGIKGNTDEIAGMGEEELKYLRDIAEQKVINRFTTAEIKVTNNMNNNISSDRDIDGMADYFAQVIERACETTAERVNTTG